jgi:hypothetical protein
VISQEALMSAQECALYGDLVLHLRDRAAELLAQSNHTNAEADRPHQNIVCSPTLEKARAMLAQAHANCPAERRDTLLWWRARLYAHYGFFKEPAAVLTALRASGPGNADVQRLWAEVTRWRDNGKWLP